MAKVGIRELSERTSEIIRKVREEHTTYDVTFRGEVVAQIQPSIPPPKLSEIENRILSREDLAKKISEDWPEGLSAAEAVAEQRREL